MNRFLKTPAARAFAAIMATLLLGALLPLIIRGTSSPVTSALGLVTGPLQGLSMSLSNAAKDFAGYFASADALRQRVNERDEEIAELRAKLVEYHDVMRKNELYEEFLELKRENPQFQFSEASIIGIEPIGDSVAAFTLNRGSVSGIRAGHPVLLGQYLIGRVAEVTLTTSTVYTIINPRVHIAAYETLTGEIGVANSTPELAGQGLAAIPQLERTTAITTGYLICTSGLGGVYPKNLIIGTVIDVVDGDQNFYVTALVQPAVDFHALRDVLVLIEQ